MIATKEKLWIKEWHGLDRLFNAWTDSGAMKSSEWRHEINMFKWIMSQVKTNKVTFIELGAGWGEWCLAATGLVRYRKINTQVKEVYCIAVEAEPTHCQWIKETFRRNNIHGEFIEAVVSDKVDIKNFFIAKNPSKEYGQKELPFYKAIGAKLSGIGSYKRVTSITVDDITKNYQNIFIHCDIQGNEVKMIEGSFNALIANKIDWMMIGIHNENYNSKIAQMLSPYMTLEFDYLPRNKYIIKGTEVEFQDGLQIYRRRNY